MNIKILKNNLNSLYRRGAIHIFFGSIFSKFIAFFGSIFLVRILTKNEFGHLSYIENLYQYVYMIAGLGLAHAVLRYIIKSKSASKELGVYDYVVNRSYIINAVILLISLFVSCIYPHPENFIDTNKIMWVILISLPVHYLVQINQFTLRAILKNRYYAISAIIIGILLVSSKMILSYYFRVQGALYSRLLVYSVSAFIFTFLFKKRYFSKIIPEKLSNSEIKEINNFSFQYMVTNSIWMFFMLNDTFMLGRLLGDPGSVADYVVAYIFPANLGLIASSIGLFVGPYFVKNEENYEWIQLNYNRLILFVLSIILPLAIIIILFSKYIIYYVYGQQYLDIVILMRILTVSAVINSVFRFTTANLLSIMGKIKYNMIISICGITMQIVLNFVFIPKFGVYGPAYTRLLVFLLMSITLWVVFKKTYKYKQSNKFN